MTATRRDGDRVVDERIVLALSADVVVTAQPQRHYAVFDKAIARMRRTPWLIGSSYGVAYALLYALNEAADRVVSYASDLLEDMSDEIDEATRGVDSRGREIGVSDMQDTITRMNRAEEIVSRAQESQPRSRAPRGTCAARSRTRTRCSRGSSRPSSRTSTA